MTVRGSSNNETEKSGSKGNLLKKSLLKFKKNKKPSTCKGGMNTVKIDF